MLDPHGIAPPICDGPPQLGQRSSARLPATARILRSFGVRFVLEFVALAVAVPFQIAPRKRREYHDSQQTAWYLVPWTLCSCKLCDHTLGALHHVASFLLPRQVLVHRIQKLLLSLASNRTLDVCLLWATEVLFQMILTALQTLSSRHRWIGVTGITSTAQGRQS